MEIIQKNGKYIQTIRAFVYIIYALVLYCICENVRVCSVYKSNSAVSGEATMLPPKKLINATHVADKQ